MESALYVGTVSHVRRVPPRNHFEYRLYMIYLDLDEIAGLDLDPVLGVERPGLLSFRRRDYRGTEGRSLKETVLDDVQQALGRRPRGPVRVLTHARSFGRAFNPVTFYYCFAEDGEALEAVVAEITNTPWNERHVYVVPAENGNAQEAFYKAFHVSPFLPMDQRYSWKLPRPGPVLRVEMTNRAEGRETFRACLTLRRRPLTRSTLLAVALTQPLMSPRILVLIYWQALKLWARGAPTFEHPAKRSAEAEPSAQQGRRPGNHPRARSRGRDEPAALMAFRARHDEVSTMASAETSRNET